MPDYSQLRSSTNDVHSPVESGRTKVYQRADLLPIYELLGQPLYGDNPQAPGDEDETYTGTDMVKKKAALKMAQRVSDLLGENNAD